MNSKLDITIIVPVYNAEQYLRECLDSICAQTYTDWKCVIVNDGSTDGSQSIIDEYCKKDTRFRFFIKENEQSASLARWYALQRIDSDWVMNVDADDAIESRFLEKIVQRQFETGADCVTGWRIGCADGLKGENWRLPLKDFDMSQILTGRECCLMTIGGWKLGGAGISKLEKALQVKPGPYMNSDEYGERVGSLLVKRHAFADAKYYFRNNVGTSDKVSVHMFDRTLVDMQLVDFVYENFHERQDKIEKMAWQRLFNLIYLTADYNIHKKEFKAAEQIKITKILKQSYDALDRRLCRKVAPIHALMTYFRFSIFSSLATKYVQYKRSHGGTFYYR